MEREENVERLRHHRRETLVLARSVTRQRLDDHGTRQSRSRTRCHESAGSRRTRSRSPVRGNGTSRRSRSRSRHGAVQLRDGESPHRARHRSRAPLRESEVSLHDRLSSRERELDRKQERLRVLEQEIIRERRSLARSSSRRTHEQNDFFTEGIDERARREGRNKRAYRDDDNEGEPSMQRRKKSVNPSFATKEVMDIITSLKEIRPQYLVHPITEAPSQSSTNFNNRNILPSFDPSSNNQRVDIWLKKVNECASVYGWDEKTMVHFAMQKLEGLAKTWYDSLNTILFSWTEWQDKLLKAFPCEQNYGQSLEDMLKRKSRFNEGIEVYYYEKLALLNRCDIEGKRAVDCIIHGISDKTMKSSALALRCSHPDQLLQFLMSNKHSGVLPDRSYNLNINSRSAYEPRTGNTSTDSGSASTKLSTSQTNPAVFCFNCKEMGLLHPYVTCPKSLIRCTVCRKVGHKSENCRFRPEESKLTT